MHYNYPVSDGEQQLDIELQIVWTSSTFGFVYFTLGVGSNSNYSDNLWVIKIDGDGWVYKIDSICTFLTSTLYNDPIMMRGLIISINTDMPEGTCSVIFGLCAFDDHWWNLYFTPWNKYILLRTIKIHLSPDISKLEQITIFSDN